MRAALALCLIVAVSGCGPSIRRTYQSDLAFTRCFDRDYDPDIGAFAKHDCWERWKAEQVINQPSDKLAYADLRLRELDAGVSVPGPPGPPGRFADRPAPDLETPTAARPQKAAPKAAPESATSAPSAGCREGCRQSLFACQKSCATATPPDAAATSPCGGACDAGFTACMKSCASVVSTPQASPPAGGNGKDTEIPLRKSP